MKEIEGFASGLRKIEIISQMIYQLEEKDKHEIFEFLNA